MKTKIRNIDRYFDASKLPPVIFEIKYEAASKSRDIDSNVLYMFAVS